VRGTPHCRCVYSDEMSNIQCLNSLQNKETWIWKNTYQFGSDQKLPVNIKTLSMNNGSEWIFSFTSCRQSHMGNTLI